MTKHKAELSIKLYEESGEVSGTCSLLKMPDELDFRISELMAEIIEISIMAIEESNKGEHERTLQ